MAEQNLYKGRKGQKRLREIEARISSLRESVDPLYADSRELEHIEGCFQDPLDKLYFFECFQCLDQIWSGVENYGFLRLCVKWIRIRKLDRLTRSDVDAMLRDILPSKESAQVREALQNLPVM